MYAWYKFPFKLVYTNFSHKSIFANDKISHFGKINSFITSNIQNQNNSTFLNDTIEYFESL